MLFETWGSLRGMETNPQILNVLFFSLAECSTLGVDVLAHPWPEAHKLISEERAPSTRRLYTHKWKVFVNWCSAKNEDPANVPDSHNFVLFTRTSG